MVHQHPPTTHTLITHAPYEPYVMATSDETPTADFRSDARELIADRAPYANGQTHACGPEVDE